MPLEPEAADRLLKLLRLTTSSFDGEALAAIRKANDLLQAAGLSWDDALAAENRPDIPDWKVIVKKCLSQTDVKLTGWERDFLVTIFPRMTISNKQRFCLERIAIRCGLARKTAA